MAFRRRPKRRRRRMVVLHPGAAPGTLRIDAAATPSKLRAVGIGPEGFEELEDPSDAAIEALRKRFSLVWLDVQGLGDESLLRRVGDLAGMHRLALEDVVNTGQRAKAERFGRTLFLVVRRPQREESCHTDQVSLVLHGDLVVSFRENDAPVFEPVLARIRDGRGRIRSGGPGYLAVALVDAVVDLYFPVLESIGESIDALEERVIGEASERTAAEIQRVRSDLVELRRALWPHRDAFVALQREESSLLGEEAQLNLRDVLDHVHQALDVLSAFRDNSSDLMGFYQTAVGNRMNEVMKVLTIIATIFIPLSFLTGLYGMNFDTEISRWNMPELGWRFGYPALWSLMLLVVAGMLVYFWRRGWLGGRR